MRLKITILLLVSIFITSNFADNYTLPEYEGIQKSVRENPGRGEDGVDPVTDKDTLERLLQHAHHCVLVGESDDKILEKYPKAQIYVTKKSKVKFFLVRDDINETQMIVIRGSANLTNWIVDFKFWKIKDSWLDIRVHKGFYEATREVFWDSVFDLNPTYKTTITGHSLGGAIAILLGMYLDNFGHPETDVITFGQPRITNKSGANKFKTFPFQRVIITADLIPHLPPRWLGYRHFGNRWYLKPKSKEGVQVANNVEEELEDPKEALELWDSWVGEVDQESFPIAKPPTISTMWLAMRDTNSPPSMSQLFASKEWERLKSLHRKVSTPSSRNKVFQLNEEVELKASVAEDSQRGNWFKWHALERYLAQLKSLLELQPVD